jgi:6-phosphogluconate dehydrogenase
MEFGLIGLGKMGGNFSLQAARKGIRIVGYSKKISDEEGLRKGGVEIARTLNDLVQDIKAPRMLFMYIPAGPVIDQVLDELVPLLSQGDVVVDAGNSFYGDSIARKLRLENDGIGYVDCGSSGGPAGALNGGCFMVGGEEQHVKLVEPVLKALAVPEGFLHVGPTGAGHFVKLIHNAIEFGMLQAIGEGTAMLKASEYDLDLAAIFHNWAHGSVIRGWLIELMEQGLRKNPDLEKISSYTEDTGEVNWAIAEALRLEVPIPVIAHSVFELFSSRDKAKIAHKSVAILRNGFGGHPIGESRSIAEYRKNSRAKAEAHLSRGSSGELDKGTHHSTQTTEQPFSH